MIIKLIGLLLLLLIFLFILYRYFQDRKHVTFVSAEDSKKFLLNDNDHYIKNMSQADLYARKVKTVEEYKSNISKCTLDFLREEKNKVRECIVLADAFLQRYTYKNMLDCKDIAKLPWKLALTYKNNSYEYEEGLPHTREHIIFLSKNTLNSERHILINTLIHEKIHIYQRYNPKVMKRLFENLGYKEVNVVVPVLQRSNPDINDQLYTDSESKQLMISTYTSSKPTNISDTSNTNYSLEHPYEKMAYDIANEYSRNYMKHITSKV